MRGKVMEPAVLKITGRDGLGRVRTLELVYDHETVDVSNPANREFLVVFLERGLLKKLNSSTTKGKN